MTLSVDMLEGLDDMTVIRCAGELDVATASKLIDAFDRAGVGRPAKVRVDLRGIDFIDSTGIGCLAHAALAFPKQGTSFEVLPSEPVKLLVVTCGLGALLAP